SGRPLRVPIGVIGPRAATDAQLAAALAVGELLGDCRLTVICGGRQGVMQAVCEGVARVGGLSIALLPEADPVAANPFVSVAIATQPTIKSRHCAVVWSCLPPGVETRVTVWPMFVASSLRATSPSDTMPTSRLSRLTTGKRRTRALPILRATSSISSVSKQ